MKRLFRFRLLKSSSRVPDEVGAEDCLSARESSGRELIKLRDIIAWRGQRCGVPQAREG